MTTIDAQARLDALDADTRDSIAQALWSRELRAEDLPAGVLERVLSEKNSNRAFGERLRYRLQAMLAQRSTFVPDYTDTYGEYLKLCDSLTPRQAYALNGLLGKDSSRGFKLLPEKADFQFPRDHAEDLATEVGWYFFVGSAKGSNGKEYGIELMFWRVALMPVPVANHFGLSAVENQVVELQFAIAEAGDRHYQANPVLIAGTTGLLDYAQGRLGATIGKNRIAPLQDGSTFPLRAQAWGVNEGGDEPVELSIDLTFSSGKEVLRQGANGCAPCCGGVGTLYYSIPDVTLDPSTSTLTLKGEQVQLTEGTFWFDHQWGTGFFPGGSPRTQILRAAASMTAPSPPGWDWFEAQFEGSRALTFAAMHSNPYRTFYQQTGPEPPGTMTIGVSGKYMGPDKFARDVSGTLEVTDWVKSVATPDPRRYPPTNTWHPNKWTFTLGEDVPEDMRSFTMEPIVSSGQTGFFAFGAQYSEGAVYLKDAAGKEIGRGFAESVMYADAAPNMLALAGLTDTEELRAHLDPKPASLLSKLSTLAYFAWPPNALALRRQVNACSENSQDQPDAPDAKK